MLTEKKPNGSAASAKKPAPRTSTKARRVSTGDTPPKNSAVAIENFAVSEKVAAARESKAVAVQDIIKRITSGNDISTLSDAIMAIVEGSSPDDAAALTNAIASMATNQTANTKANADDELAKGWRDGAYPYKNLLSRRRYEKQKYHLQVELLKLQAWVKETGQRVVILFEGRDAAGKGGTIRRFMEHLNPRGARVVALEKPSEVEQGQWYFQRYVSHLPTAGEISLFDRSWYNRAGVERVMGFCNNDEYIEFMRQAPEFERNLTRSGIHIIKFWFSVSREEQRRRFKERKMHPTQTMETQPDRLGIT